MDLMAAKILWHASGLRLCLLDFLDVAPDMQLGHDYRQRPEAKALGLWQRTSLLMHTGIMSGDAKARVVTCMI